MKTEHLINIINALTPFTSDIVYIEQKMEYFYPEVIYIKFTALIKNETYENIIQALNHLHYNILNIISEDNSALLNIRIIPGRN